MLQMLVAIFWISVLDETQASLAKILITVKCDCTMVTIPDVATIYISVQLYLTAYRPRILLSETAHVMLLQVDARAARVDKTRFHRFLPCYQYTT